MSDEDGRQATATVMATKRVMATAMTLAGNKEGNDGSDKSNGDGNKGGGHAN